MFKYITIACVLAAVCAAAPSQNPQDVKILRYDNDINQGGAYNFVYETSDGTSRQEEGKIENKQSENPGLAVTGQYTYFAPEGEHYMVTFTADRNGFQPKTSLVQ